MITTVRLVNPSITSHNYLSLCVVRTFKVYSLGSFQVYNTVLFMLITRMYIRSLELTHKRKPVHSDQHLPFPPPTRPWQPPVYCLFP